MRLTDPSTRLRIALAGITVAAVAIGGIWLLTHRSPSTRASLQPATASSAAASSSAPSTSVWVSTTFPATTSPATSNPATSAPTTAATTTVAVHGGGTGSGSTWGLPSTNTYPYHSTGVDWAGLNTTDPRCAPILRNQRILELPNFRGKTLQQAVAAIDPIGMYSYCTNGTIIMVQFVRDTDQCTTDAALFEHIAAQSPAPGVRVTPGIFQLHLTYFNGLCPTPTT
jgi:hypothetical protein